MLPRPDKAKKGVDKRFCSIKKQQIVLIYKHNRLLLTQRKNQTVRQKFSGLEIVEVSKKHYKFYAIF